jgi:hypothetical protein
VVASNRERVGRAIELLGVGLGPYVDRRMTRHSTVGGNWKAAHTGKNVDSDASALISVILDNWQYVFREHLRNKGRSWLGEAKDCRNNWAHNVNFSDPETERALNTVELLLNLIEAPEAAEVGRLWQGCSGPWTNVRTTA